MPNALTMRTSTTAMLLLSGAMAFAQFQPDDLVGTLAYADPAPFMKPARAPLPGSGAVPGPLEVDATLDLQVDARASRLHVGWRDRSLLRMPVELRTVDGRLIRLDCITASHDLSLCDLPPGGYQLLLMDLHGVKARQIFNIAR